MLDGTDDKPGIRALEHELRLVTRQRGRVWRKVFPAGQVSPDGVVSVTVGDPKPHGLEENAIVYLFEYDDPNSPTTTLETRYLGDFRVTATAEEGVTLEPILLVDLNGKVVNDHLLAKLGNSQGPWSFYETMPADRHNLYADMTEEEIRELFKGLPDEVVEQYVRHGQEANDDDDPLDIIYLDAKGDRVDPEEEENVVKKVYDRPLRDYEYLFGELSRQRTVMLSKWQSENEDYIKMQAALESAKKLEQFRTQEKNDLTIDRDAMRLEQQTVEAHRDQVQGGLSGAKQRIKVLLDKNATLAAELKATQMKLANLINLNAPAPAGTGTPAP